MLTNAGARPARDRVRRELALRVEGQQGQPAAGPAATPVGDIFLKYAALFSEYRTYSMNYPSAVRLLRQLKPSSALGLSRKHKFGRFINQARPASLALALTHIPLQRRESIHELRGMEFEAMLLYPCMRIQQ